MDDLTSLKGIGKATVKKLRDAGIDSFAKLAAATPDQLNAAQVAGGPADWTAMIAEARDKQASAAPRELTAEQVNALVRAWDDARAALSSAGDNVAAIQEQLDALAPEADRGALEQQLEAARAEVTKAHAAIDALQPLPDGTKLPSAPKAKQTNEQIPAGPRGADAGQPGGKPPAPNSATKGPGGEPAEDALSNSAAVAGAAGLITITVIGPPKGRRRAGHSFSPVPVTISVSADELALIKADPTLAVSDGKLPTPAERGAAQERLSADDFVFEGMLSIQVLGPAKGRRRAGFHFGAQAQTVEVTREQLQIILADESLAVTTA